jgi:hypothetical protein
MLWLHRRQGGFTVVEVALVMMLFALLAGIVLAANELILSARARALSADLDAYRSAYFGFLDRYRAMPGDMGTAVRDIRGTTTNGNGDGRIEAAGVVDEPALAWEHLVRAGYLQGRYRTIDRPAPVNVFGAPARVETGNRFAGGVAVRHNFNTGNLVPASVLAEIDRKLDDGFATTGAVRFSYVDTAGVPPAAERCFDTLAVAAGLWRIGNGEDTNCGATWLLP